MRTATINGLPVVNAKKAIILKVNTADIKSAKTKDPSGCAAAVACRRQLGATEARVHLGRTYVRYNGRWERYITSSPLRDEVVAFDRGGRFEPGEYYLLRIQPSKAKGGKQGAVKYKKRGNKRKSPHFISGVRPVGIYA